MVSCSTTAFELENKACQLKALNRAARAGYVTYELSFRFLDIAITSRNKKQQHQTFEMFSK